MSRLVLSARDRRTLLAGASVVGGLIALARGLPAWRAWDADARASAAELTAERVRAERSVAGERSTVRAFRERAARYVALAPAVVPGPTPAAQAAALGAIVSGAAQGAGLKLGAVQVAVDSAASGDARRRAAAPSAFARLRVRADATGDVKGITDFLLALERGPALLRVRGLAVTQPEPAAPPERAEALRVEVVVEGLGLAPPPPKTGVGPKSVKTVNPAEGR